MTTLKQSLLAFTVATFGLIACKNSNRHNNNETNVSAIDTLKDNTISNVSQKDTIDYTNSYFPVDSLLSTKVLTVGTFHSDEVWDKADKQKWLGLFQNKTGFYIAETKLKTKRVNDVVIDENDNDKTGWEVQTTNKDTSLILIEPLSYLTTRKVEQAILSKNQIFPDDTLKLSYLGIEYALFATGGKRKTQDNPQWFEVWDYKLYLSATIKGQSYKTLLVSAQNFNDQMIKLIFAGDIDGDGILDLIIDTSNHYNATSPTIYLSKPSDKKELVKPIGIHTSVGC